MDQDLNITEMDPELIIGMDLDLNIGRD